MSEKKVLTYELQVKGVFGRNRKAKSTHATLQTVAPDAVQPTEEELRKEAESALRLLGVKPGATWLVLKRPETLSTFTGSGGAEYTTRAFMLFSDTVLFRGTV